MYYTQKTFEELIEDINEGISDAIEAGQDELTFYVHKSFSAQLENDLRIAGYPFMNMGTCFSNSDSKYWITW